MALCQAYCFGPRWYHAKTCLHWSIGYYRALRQALRESPDLRQLLCRCRHCGIRFLTSPSNRGRKDLGCPMGCAKAHRDQSARNRSQIYYQSTEGRIKKRKLNRNRSKRSGPSSSVEFSGSCPRIIVYLCLIARWVGHELVSFSQMHKRYLFILEQVRQHSLGMDSKVCEIPDG